MLYFKCDPSKNKALCCREKDITLELLLDEIKLFEPDKAVFMLNSLGFDDGRKTKNLPYSITNPTFHKRSEVRLAKVIGIPTSITDLDVITVWFPGDKGCYHLGEDNRCSIYNRRPIICRTYPFLNSEKEFAVAMRTASEKERLSILKGEKKYLHIFFSKCKKCCKECLSNEKRKGYLPLDKLKNRIQKETVRIANKVMENHRNYFESFFKRYFPSYIKFLIPSLDKYSSIAYLMAPQPFYSPLLTAVLIYEVFGEDGIKAQIKAVRNLLQGKQLDGEERKAMEVYLSLLEENAYKEILKKDQEDWEKHKEKVMEIILPSILKKFESFRLTMAKKGKY